MSLFDELDLGAEDYSPEKSSGLGQFTSKPSPRPYQPFGGPIQQAPQSFIPDPEPVESPMNYYSPQSIFADEDLDGYDRAKKDYGDISSYSSAAATISRKKNSVYKDFRSQKLLPFYESLGGFGDYDDDEEFASEIDSMYDQALKTSQMDDGFFGPSDEKLAAQESLKKFALWNQPNGLRDQYRRLRSEKDQYQGIADAYESEKVRRLEQLTAIPIPAKRALDDALKFRNKKPGSKKKMNELLDGMSWEQPVVGYDGEVQNLEKVDPRAKINPAIGYDGQGNQSSKAQKERVAAAMRGDLNGVLSRRNQVARDRQLRDKGLLFSLGGMLDGRPIGMSRKDVDLLDIDDLKKYGIEEYKGVPIEQAINELGGQERLEVAKVLQSVRANYNEFEKAQIEWLTSGRKDELKTKMDQAREAFQNSVGMANEYGLTDELVEQNEKKGFFARLGENIGNAISRGSKLNEMSKYSMDFFTNSADINDIDKFIDLAEELGEIPTGSAAQKFQQYKSKGFWDSVSNLLFDNTEAIPELFVESLSSFLPAYFRTGMKTIPGGAAIGFATPVPGGTIAGAKIAARANWGVASFVLEYSGMILQGMQELNIDWQNPKVFAAAWNNEIIRDEIKDKALKKGLPIALMDSISGLMSGRISAGLHHIKGGKLLDGKAWKKSKETYPRFTGFQRAANIGTDIAADATLGMGGEFLGQAWSKEPGEEWDHNAIVAEGIVGLGPGLLGGAYEYTSTRNLDLSNTPFQYQNVKNTPDGQSGTVNLAGFTNEFNSFNTAQGAASHIINQGNYANPEARNNAAKVLTDLMARLYALNPAEMKDLKLVVADRTPFADKEMEGSYHHDHETGTSVIYLNRNKIGQDPLGVFLHESGHLARKLMISEQKLLDIYQAIGENAQRDSFAQYTLKIPGIRYGKLSESQKSQVDSAWGKMGEMRRAEEWFSYQWASLLAGNNIDASVKTEYQNFLTQVIHPTMEKFLGGETTGGTKAQQFELNQIILQKMGFNPNGIREDGNARFGEYYNERPGMAELFLNKKLPIQQMGDEEALNSMMRKVSIIAQTQGLAQAKRVVEATNKILGEKVLPTDMSAYTRRELRSKVLPVADARVAAEDAVATAEVYETLEGEDAKNAVNELVETKEKAVEKDVTPDVSASRKQVVKNKETATKTRKVAKIEKAIDEKEQAVVSEINQVQNLMPGSEIVDSKDGKFRLKLRLPGTRKALPARIFETREEAEKAEKEFYADEREKLTNISKKVSSLMKLAQNEKEFEKEAEKTKKALLARLKADKKQLTKEDLSNSLSDEDKTRIVEKSKTEEGLTENDLSYGQIIAEMMGLNDLMDNAIFSSSLLAMDLADVSSGKAPDGQRVVDAIEKYNQQVEFATGAIDSRISELELNKKELLLEKQLLQGQITQDVYEKKQKGLTALGSKQAKKSGLTALGSKQAKQGRLPKGKWVVVFRGPQGNWKKWKDGKWVNAPKLDGNKFVKKRLDKNVYRYVAADKTAADKALNEKQRKYVSFWREPEANQAKPQAKAKAKPEPRKEKEPETKKPEPEAKKVDSPRLKQIESELKEINKTLTLLREYRHAIEPEKAAIDWKDTPHFGYRKYVGPGDGPTKENKGFDDKNFEPYTLGQLAEYDRDGTPIWQKTFDDKKKRYMWNIVTVSDTQKYLFNYTDWRKHLPDETKKEEKPDPKAKEVKEEKSEAPKAIAEARENAVDAEIVEDEPKALGSGIDKSQAFNPFVKGRKMDSKLSWFGNRTVQEYVDILDAVRASAALPENVGSRRYTDGDRIFFQSENGTSVAAMMLFRLKEMDKKAGFNGRKITSGSIEDISLAEMSVYELATGRALEILDDRDIRGSKQQRYHQLIERRAYEMAQDIKEYEKLLKAETDPKKKEGIERNIERLGQQLLALYFDYDEAGSFQGEETGGFFPKIHGGKQWSETLTEFLFFKEKEQAVDKILDIWEEDIARDQGAGLGKKPKESRNRPAWGLDAELWAKYTDIYRALLRASGKSKEELKKDLDALKEAHIERRDEAQRTYQEEYEKKLADEGVQAAKKWDAKVTAPEDYEFFAMGEKATQQVPAKNDHGSFARGNVDEGVDVISMFAKGRTGTEGFTPERTTFGTGFGSEQASPDLARDLERRLDKAIADKAIEVLQDEKYQDIDLFEITRANGKKLKVKRVGGLWKKANGHVLDKDLEDLAREEFIKNDPKLISQIKGVIAAQDALATSGVTSGDAVSPLQFVEYLLSVARDGSSLKKAILSLQYIPSSEVKDGTLKQMPGGPGGGILPYVWKDFVTEVYKLLKINEEPVFTPAKDPKKSGWQDLSEEVTRTVKNKDGKQTRVSEPNTLWTNGVPDVDAMIAQSKKIIQAVYDSGRIMLAPGRGLDEAETNKNSPNASNVLQQDPSVHTSSLEDFIKNDAPEGSLDNMEIDDGGLQKTVQADQQESAALPDEGIKTLKDTDTIPQSFATANDPIASKLEGTETNKKLFNLKKDGKALSLKKVIQEFRTDEVFWNAFGLPMPPAPKQEASSSLLKKVGLTKEQVQSMTGKESKEILQFAKDLKVHPNYPYLKARVLDPGTTSLGSNYSLSSGVPSDSIKAVNMLTRMANKVGLGEEGMQEMRDYLKKHKDRFSKQGIISAALDSSRPATSIISKALKDVGIDNKQLLDQLDVKGLIQQYFGKTDEIVRQAHLRFIEPIEDALADHGISSREFGEYLLARAAPSRNAHIKKLYTEYLNDAKEEKKEAIQEMLDKYGDRMSGISNETAIAVVKEFEQNKSFRAFLKDERAPLQKFYAFNREALRHRAEGGLMRTDSAVDGINEEIAMVKASSSFNWKKDGGSEFMYQENGKDNNYSYAPMQGFEGETETLFDNERAYEVAGKSSTAAGRAWDMPKHKFLFDGSFGRLDENAVAPDPEMVFPVSQSQYYEGAILGQKNMVSTAIGQVFEILRSVAFHGEKAPLGDLPYLDLNTVPGGKEILNKLEKDPSIKETTRELFEGKDAVFEKKFENMVEKKHYEIQTKDIEVDGKKVDGMVMARRMINTEFQNNPSVFVYRQNGEPRYIKMKNNERGMRFASAIKNLRYETLPTFLREVNGVTRFMASMFTSKNPAFIIPNFVRDLGTAYLHLSEDDKQAFVKNVFRPERLRGFIGGIFKVEQKKARGEATLMELPKDPEQAKKYAQQLLADNDYEKMYQFAVQAGAKVGYFRTKPVTEMIEDMQKLHKKGGKTKKSERRKIKQMIDTFDSINTSVENSIRMSAFWSAIENGRSVHEAANISRNVTVDFNQKGTMTQTLGAFFVFFGASMNSIDRMMTMFQRRGYKRSRNLIAAVAAASFALNIFNRLMDDDEDEAESGYDRIPSYRRDTMALFSTPGKDNTGYFGIPLPLGYNMFWTMGQTAADFFAKHVMGRGGAGSVEFMERNMSATLNAFNPVGGASLATALIPTSIKPLVEVWANQNFMGSPIRMEDRPFEAPEPAHMMDPKRTQEHWTAISKGINKLMGGNDEVKGSLGGLFGSHPLKSLDDSDVRWNISGSQLEHILLGYTGGPGQIVNAMFGGLIWPGLPGTNEDYGKFDANKMPITNRFYRSSTSDASTKNAYYQIRTATLTAERAVRAAKIAGSKEYSSMRNEMKDLLALSDSIKYADAFKSKVRKQKSKIEEAKNLTQDQKFQRIAELEKREHDAYVAVIKKAQSLGIS